MSIEQRPLTVSCRLTRREVTEEPCVRVDRDGPAHGRIAVVSDPAGIWLELHQVALAAFRGRTLENAA